MLNVRPTLGSLLLWFLLCGGIGLAAAQRDLQLLVIEWVTTLSLNQSQDYREKLAVAVNMLLAAKHINDRRSDILPVLEMAQCNRNVSIRAFLDDSGYPSRDMEVIAKLADEIDAVVGVSSSLTAVHTAFMGTAYSLPIVSHSASVTALSQKLFYPYFARTAICDFSIATKITRLLFQWGYRKFGLLHVRVSLCIALKKFQCPWN